MNPVDAAWWRMDTPTNRMIIVGLLEFDRVFTAADFTALLEERLQSFERFRRRVSAVSGRPHWEDDPEFSFSNHVVSVSDDPPTDDASLKALVGGLMSAPFPAERPPWEFVVVESFKGGSVVIARLHHAIADGIALIHVLRSLADDADADGSASLVAMPQTRRPTGGTTIEEAEDVLEPVEARRLGLSDIVSWFRRLPRLTVALAKFAFTGSDRKTRFRGAQGVEKRVDWSGALDLSALRKAAVSHSATINDVLLAVVSGGLRRYLERYRELAEDFELRALIPVNLRHRHEELGLGNRFGLVILALPVGLRNLAARITAVNRRMLDARNSMEPVAAFGVLTALGRSPGFVENAAVWKLSSTSSAAITHVPGPRKRLVLGGRTLSDLMFWVPRGGSVGMGISILTYAGRARIGLATDAALVPDPDALAMGISAELADLGLS